jgi:hypothetical protein
VGKNQESRIKGKQNTLIVFCSLASTQSAPLRAANGSDGRLSFFSFLILDS